MKTVAMPLFASLLALLAGSIPALALGNPASAYCVSRGGRVDVVEGANGGQRGFCVLPDGTRVDEWTYFRNTHRTR